jgi:DMSO/TMAO reductase YedYZ molybdopterin-dependent catalytic subunit
MDDQPKRSDDRVPPGQYVTEKWPVLTYGATPVVSPKEYQLRIFGLVKSEAVLDWGELTSLPKLEVDADFHCVTRFSMLDNRWQGFSTRGLLDRVAVDAEATHVLAHCYGGYTTNMPLEDFLSEHALFAHSRNGEPIDPDHGGPLRLIVPHLYAWKSAKWINGIELLDGDKRGFWEENGYHTYGDPWTEQRFSSQETKEAYQVRRKAKDLGIVPGSDLTTDDES